MTVSSLTNRVSFTGNGVTTSFSTSPITFVQSSDLTVMVVVTATGVGTTLVEGTGYSVTGGSGATGTVNTAGGSAPYGAPASTVKLVIICDPDILQETDFVQNDPSDAEVAERVADQLTRIARRTREIVTRTLHQPDSDATDITEMPNAVARASKYMSFDASGNPVATSGTTSVIVVSSFAETFLDDTTAAGVRATIGAVGLTGDETVAGDKTFSGIVSAASVAGAAVATQANMETGTATNLIVPPGRQAFHPGHPKCWAMVTVAAGVPTLQSSFNITSITDSATGRLTVTVATDFSTANWCCLAQGEITQISSSQFMSVSIETGTLLAGSVVLNCTNIVLSAGPPPTQALADPLSWHMMGLGDQA